MKKVAIDRSKWRFGGDEDDDLVEDRGPTLLLNDAGNMCCLGFAAKQLAGLDDKDMSSAIDPGDLEFELKPLNYKDNISGRIRCSDFTFNAAWINDKEISSISNSKREKGLIEHFVSVDIELTFYNDYI